MLIQNKSTCVPRLRALTVTSDATGPDASAALGGGGGGGGVNGIVGKTPGGVCAAHIQEDTTCFNP